MNVFWCGNLTVAGSQCSHKTHSSDAFNQLRYRFRPIFLWCCRKSISLSRDVLLKHFQDYFNSSIRTTFFSWKFSFRRNPFFSIMKTFVRSNTWNSTVWINRDHDRCKEHKADLVISSDTHVHWALNTQHIAYLNVDSQLPADLFRIY